MPGSDMRPGNEWSDVTDENIHLYRLAVAVVVAIVLAVVIVVVTVTAAVVSASFAVVDIVAADNFPKNRIHFAVAVETAAAAAAPRPIVGPIDENKYYDYFVCSAGCKRILQN